MKDFLTKLVSLIVEDPKEIEIKTEEDQGQTVYTIILPENEVGRVIGKQGKIITAIRCLAKLKATKSQEKVFIKVEGRS